MTRVIRCTACGISLTEPVGPCPHCGGTIEVSVQLTGHQINAQLSNIGAVAREAIDGGGERIRYSAPTGAQSDTRIDQRIHAVVKAPVDAGRRGEDDVFARVLEVLAASGARAVIEPLPQDDAGEDRIVRIGDKRITIQIIAASPGTLFWKDVASGRGEVEADFETAAQWVNEAIASKATLYSSSQKRAMLLALDIRHFGVLADPAIVAIYIQRYGEPDALGFGAVWLIGPTVDQCIRLGNSQW